MASGRDDFAHIRELFSAFGPVAVRRMFGGAGVYAEGTMFALITDDVIYLKSDDTSAENFEREGCEAFAYAAKDGRRTVMSYRRLPERLYDDPEELARWAAQALRRRCASRSWAALSGSGAELCCRRRGVYAIRVKASKQVWR